MSKLSRIFQGLLLGLLPLTLLANEPASEVVVVFKMDDVRATRGDVPERWKRLYDFAIAEQVPVSMGIICDSLEGDQPAYFATLKDWSGSEFIELWNHGYDHKRWTEGDVKISEFSKSGLEHQRKHIGDSQRLGREKLGVTFCTFGAPFNAVDDDTRTAMSDFPELNVWLYGSSKGVPGVKTLKRDYKVNLEPKVGHVDFEVFKGRFESNPPKSPLVLQGHPGMWDDREFAEFIKIVSYLREQGATFALPRDFAPEAS